MNKRILLLTCGSGGGHRSSSNAIKEALFQLDPTINVNDYDSNKLFLGYRGEGGEQGYVTFTTKFRYLWKIFFEITSFFKGISNFFLSLAIRKNFEKLINAYNPDIILTVHPCFVRSVAICLKKMKRDIPLYTCIIDLVKHSRLWHDKKGAATFVPTQKMCESLLKKGFEETKLVHSGFPIGEKFGKLRKGTRLDIKTPKVLMVNPSEKGHKQTLKLIQAALQHNIDLTIVTGSDEKLKNFLSKSLANIPNIVLLGYVSDMDNRLSNADVLVTKAGPNMMLEAVKLCVPVLVTGCLLGQEEKNYQYIVENGYGLNCKSPKRLREAFTQLFENDYELLKKFSLNEQSCTDISGAKVVAEYLINALDTLN